MSSFIHLRHSLLRRALHTTPIRKTDRPTVFTNMLAGDVPPPVQVSSITSTGIQLADGLILPSACIFLDGKVYLWDVPARLWDGWGRAHWDIFEVIVPKPGAFEVLLTRKAFTKYEVEILVFGTGRRMELPPPSIRGFLREMGIQLDIMDTVGSTTLPAVLLSMTFFILAEKRVFDV